MAVDTEYCYAEFSLCWVSRISPLCSVLVCQRSWHP